MGQLLPGDFEGLLMSRPGSLQLGTHVAKRCRIDFLEVDKVSNFCFRAIYVLSGDTLD